jgi:DNA-binding SARP family transcriptional activator/tetratricopeptide (TPR) repeat protein
VVEFRLLGPVEIRDGGRMLPVGSGRERFVLAMLLLHADRLTSADWLIDTLWPAPPASARAQLHNIISSLRRRLHGRNDELIMTRPLGYELRLGPHRLDVLEFRRLAAGGRQAAASGDHGRAAAMLADGLSLWRGPALADVADELAAETRRALHEEKLVAAEAKLQAGLALGRFDEVLADLAGLMADHPYREELYQVQMLALVGAGRRADALSAYRQVYRMLADELGIEPGPGLRELEQRILRGEHVGPVRAAGLVPPRQLPPATAVLTGRDQLVARICTVLCRPGTAAGPVVLVGPGGVGKTALALAAAHRLHGAFPDGQLYADLRGSHDNPADSHAVVGRFLRALGLDGAQLPDDPDERIAMYRSRLAGKRMLVVLDDAAGEEQMRPLLPGDAGCRTLVTSRRRLGALFGAAARWTVPVLEPADAVELLARIVGHQRVAAEPKAAAATVELCGRLPLAVCVAAARLAVRPDWTMAEFEVRLAEERRRLDELVVGDLDVRASIGLSYRALDPQPRELLRRLGLLAAPDWPTWVAQALLDRPVEQLLDRLADVHLVEPLGRDAAGQRRFRLHDLIADFARERAFDEDVESERHEALSRMLSGWLALATEADERVGHGMISAAGLAAPPPPEGAEGPARTTPREWFEAERISLVTAVDQACRLGLPDIAGGLALRLSGFLTVRSFDDDREHTLRQATACAREGGSEELRIRLAGALFAISLHRSRTDELPCIAAEELTLARRLGDRQREVGALANAGWAARVAGRLTEAAGWLEQAVATCSPDTPSRLMTRALNGLAIVHREAGQPARALPLTRQALAIERQQGRPLITAICLINHAGALTDAGLLTEAEDAITEAIDLIGEKGDLLTATDVDLVRAEIDIRRGRWQSATQRLNRFLRLLEARSDWAGVADVLRALGDVAICRGEPHEAIEPLRRSEAIWRRLGVPLETVRVLARLDHALIAIGDSDSAAGYRREYRTILAELDLDEACLRLAPSSV